MVSSPESRTAQSHSVPPPKSRLRVATAGLLLILCVTLVVVVTMWPTPLDRGFESSIDRLLEVLYRNGVPAWFGYNKLEFSANVVMFVPIGLLVAMVLPGGAWWVAIVLCAGFSVGVESVQGAYLSARFATVYDVIANSIGGLVGVVSTVTLRAIVHERDSKLLARAQWEWMTNAR